MIGAKKTKKPKLNTKTVVSKVFQFGTDGSEPAWARGMVNPNANMHGIVSFGSVSSSLPPFVVIFHFFEICFFFVF